MCSVETCMRVRYILMEILSEPMYVPCFLAWHVPRRGPHACVTKM